MDFSNHTICEIIVVDKITRTHIDQVELLFHSPDDIAAPTNNAVNYGLVLFNRETDGYPKYLCIDESIYRMNSGVTQFDTSKHRMMLSYPPLNLGVHNGNAHSQWSSPIVPKPGP